MPVLNPFLRALFQGSVLGQSLPAQNYVLLIPTSESLLTGQDRETGKKYVELCEDEDFLGSHILRIPPAVISARESSIRDSRTKAKTYGTVNNRTLIIKDGTVYSNKGFKQLTQATLLQDALYFSPGPEMQQWLIYYISGPLVGTYETIQTKLPVLGSHMNKPVIANGSAQPVKKDIKSFNELLNHFPMIARQMQPGLERLFNEFGKELGRPLPPPPSRTSTPASLDGSTQVSDSSSIKSNGSVKVPFNSTYFDDEEDLMRKALETAVTAAIDLFQGVDKQQLSFLGATTDLTGPTVEKLIERYVAESVHDSLLFPRLCSFHRSQDHELDHRIKQMDSLDVAQVGISLEDDREDKKDLLDRISRGVSTFRRLGVAGSPQEMLDILLEAQKVVSESGRDGSLPDEEKRATAITINADVLVSLLLLVVIRSQVRHLQTRLAYMQRFIYIDDVESGEMGYALSTLEAVLTYLARDAGGLRKASKQNKILWDAIKFGQIEEVKSIFSGSTPVVPDENTEDPQSRSEERPTLSRKTTAESAVSTINGDISRTSSHEGDLSHVFPFQAADSTAQPKRKKRVHLDARSFSISSSMSILSRTATIETTLSTIEGDTSVQSLAQTQDSSGNSVLMMAVENQQCKSLQYLLTLSDHYPPLVVLADTTSEGTTLLSAAIQLANEELVEVLLDYLERNIDELEFKQYVSKPDVRGRCAAHYLFNLPHLINRLTGMIPWRQRDKIGHTPLFAICRTYDHNDYTDMVSEALAAAQTAQDDGQALRVGEHADDKGNSLLHIINDSTIMHRVLHQCDTDPNAMNSKKFTPLMLASKYGRIDMVRVFFGDLRIDLNLKEARGLTAVELAKDDEVRNRIDDLTLFSITASTNVPDMTGRITAIVRSFFVEDGSTRYIIKSGAPNNSVSSTTYTITTSRRSLQDFENLAKWLSMDHPASYIPSVSATQFRSPFQLHSKPSRAVLHDTQTRLDRFLKLMMTHPTFCTHEMLWEFFLVPDMLPDQIAQRAKLKGELIKEKIADDYDPMTAKSDLGEVESVVLHSRDSVRKINNNTRVMLRKGYAYSHAHDDLAHACTLAALTIATLGVPSSTLPKPHIEAATKLAALMHSEPSSFPLDIYLLGLSSFHSTVTAIQSSLLRPSTLISQILAEQRALERNRQFLSSSATPRKGLMNTLNLPGMEENRIKSMRDTEAKIIQSEMDIEQYGKELRYTQEVVLGELAGWTTWRENHGKEEIRRYARATVVRERERLKGMQRVMRTLKEKIGAATEQKTA